MLSLTFLASLLVSSCSGESRRRLNNDWEQTPDEGGLKTAWSSSSDAPDNLQYVKAYIRCTRGEVKMFWGDLDELPFGWQQCDGSKGSPDLRDRFLIGAGKKFPYWSRGGNDKIRLMVSQLPAHKHNIWAKDMVVSECGAHDHVATGDIAHDEGHDHDQGSLKTDKQGGHQHSFWAQTKENEGGHIHWALGLTNSDENEHDHGIDFESGAGGEHNHKDDFKVNEMGSKHKHPLYVEVDEGGDHVHDLEIDAFTLSIGPHSHGVGQYTIKDHKDTISVELKDAYTSKNGTHVHKVEGYTKYDGFQEEVEFDLMTEGWEDHKHGFGDLKTEECGKHSHWISEILLEDLADHDHNVTGYTSSGWDTKREDEIFNLPLDRVDSTKSWSIPTSEWAGFDLTVPPHQTWEEGLHTHEISGNTAYAGGNNGLKVKGSIGPIKKHWHQIDLTTKPEADHWHTVKGTITDYELELKHELSGTSDPHGGFTITKQKGELTGESVDDGRHTHTARARVTEDSGAHVHGLDGGVQGVGNHTHRVKGKTAKWRAHSHDITGYIGAADDGYHQHTLKNDTAYQRDHDHKITGKVGMDGRHKHTITITVQENTQLHKHEVSGKSGYTGNNEEIDITPPYVSLWAVCCTNDQSGSWSFSSSEEEYTQQPWITQPPKEWTTRQPEKWESEV